SRVSGLSGLSTSLFLKDLTRIVGKIRIGEINNHSNYPWFRFLAKKWQSPRIRKLREKQRKA
ncbi:MAG: hypothetical protein PUB69_02830, partial [Desulfovibrionaceae bacterium]|nr:hypothetical protein [Desulfovibrionaceae bacterium]